MLQSLIPLLECPLCHGELAWTLTECQGDHVATAEAVCRHCSSLYPVLDGIAAFLTPDLRRNDLWEVSDTKLTHSLRENPQVEHQLMDSEIDALGPADQFFRTLVLEEQGNYDQARDLATMATRRLYTPEWLSAYQSEAAHLVGRISLQGGPLVDLASGRCDLVQVLAGELGRPVVATDFSPRVLRNSRRRLAHLGLDRNLGLLAFDARRTPFKSGALDTLTTNQGLSNIEQPLDLLHELRRVVRGEFLAITHFYPPGDGNAAAIRELGLPTLLYRDSTLDAFAAAGFEVELANVQTALAKPTPASVLLEGARIDGLPVVPTELQWCLLVAH